MPPETTGAGRVAPGPRVTRDLLVLSGVVVVAWVLVLALWADAPFALTFDDAYYYFGIARNVAAGKGSTFDGINATNGYHPLWLALAVPVFKAGLDDLAAARALLGLQIVVGWGGTLALLSVLLGRAVDGWPRLRARPAASTAATRNGEGDEAGATTTQRAGTRPAGPAPSPDDDHRRWATALLVAVFALATGNPYVLRTFTNGLESGVAVLVYAALLLVVAGGARRRVGDDASAPVSAGDGGWVSGTTTRWRLGVSLLLALAFLARTDAVLLFAAAGVWCLAEARRAARDGRPWLGPLVELFAVPAVVIVAYLVWNQAAFGTPVQVSGLHKRAELTASNVVVFALFVVGAAAVGRWGFRRVEGSSSANARRLARVGTFAARSGWFAAFGILVVGYYVVLQTQVWLWYFAPVVLWLLVAFLLFVADATEETLAGAGRRSPTRALAPLTTILLVPLVLGLVFGARSFADPDVLSIQKANAEAGEWIRADLPDDAVLASWDAGVVGYFSHRPVVNLDGVANSYEYYEATQAGAPAVRAFLDDAGVRYIVNHGGDVDGQDPDIRSFIRTVWGPSASEAATVVHRQPFRYSGTTTGSAGFTTSDGAQQMNVYVYALPAASSR
ncbi:MAG: hypothetical protein R2726_04510 [Acidimicrobiales bacterium]